MISVCDGAENGASLSAAECSLYWRFTILLLGIKCCFAILINPGQILKGPMYLHLEGPACATTRAHVTLYAAHRSDLYLIVCGIRMEFGALVTKVTFALGHAVTRGRKFPSRPHTCQVLACEKEELVVALLLHRSTKNKLS